MNEGVRAVDEHSHKDDFDDLWPEFAGPRPVRAEEPSVMDYVENLQATLAHGGRADSQHCTAADDRH